MNYVANQVGVPYTRVRQMTIDYQRPNTASVRCIETQSVLLADGSVSALPRPESDLLITIQPQDFARSVQLVHPDTGLAIPGATMTIQQIMLGILAVVREAQVARDLAASAPAPEAP